jgi:protease-4
MASMTKPMSEEHRKLLQGYIDESLARFKEVVLSGRPGFKQNPDALDQLATGEIFSATRARQNGLVDEIGFLEDAISRATTLAGLSPDDVRIVHYHQPVSLIDLGLLANTQTRASSRHPLHELFDLGTPRAYYLASTIPPLLSSYAAIAGR